MWILDASVAVKWFITDEEGYVSAKKVLSALVEQPDVFAVPDFFFVETAAVLTRKSGWDNRFVEQAMSHLFELGIATVPVGEKLMGRAVALSCSHRMMVYDGLYLATAESMDGRWLTADERGVARVGKALAVCLGDF